jgi:hypothetical protein
LGLGSLAVLVPLDELVKTADAVYSSVVGKKNKNEIDRDLDWKKVAFLNLPRKLCERAVEGKHLLDGERTLVADAVVWEAVCAFAGRKGM